MDLVWLAFAGIAAYAMLSLISSEKQRQTQDAEIAAHAAAAQVAADEAADASSGVQAH